MLPLALLFGLAGLTRGALNYVECRNYGRNADGLGTRFLPVQALYDQTETPTSCIAKCKEMGLEYAGMQGAAGLRQCYCGSNANRLSGGVANESRALFNCSATTCNGRPCGDSFAVAVYEDTAILNPNVTSFGCYNDSSITVPLQYGGWGQGLLGTPTQCVNACLRLGFEIAAVKIGLVCFCGTAAQAISQGVAAASRCSSTCFDGSACGGATTLSLYASDQTAVTATFIGCFDNSPSTGRTFTFPGYNIPSSGGFNLPETPERCLTFCNSRGFAYAGIDSTIFCACGGVEQTQVAGKRDSNASCSDAAWPCNVARSDGGTCGGPGSRMSVYANLDYALPAISTTGCVPSGTFAFVRGADNYPTPEYCANECRDRGFVYGAADLLQCYCGTATEFNAVANTTLGICTALCTGKTSSDTFRFCGSSDRSAISVYLNN